MKQPQSYYTIWYKDLEDIVNGDYLKSFRENNNLTQLRLSNILKVSKNKIEKWEKGKKPIKGTSMILIYLLNEHPELLDELYNEKFVYKGDIK